MEYQSLVLDSPPGTILAKCCNSFCTNIERARKLNLLSYCSGCESRVYCSPECSKTDWVFHRKECSAGASKMKKGGPAQAKSRSTINIEPLQKGEHVMLRRLKARPELNGKLGIIAGALNSDERYPVRVETATIAVRPCNILQLGVIVSEKSGKPQKCKCSAHGEELCDLCSMDLRIVNQLLKLRHLGQPVNEAQFEEVAELSFMNVELNESGPREKEPDYPLKCSGLEDSDKNFFLKHLLIHLNEMEPRLAALPMSIVAAINGLCCYSVAKEAVVKPYAISLL